MSEPDSVLDKLYPTMKKAELSPPPTNPPAEGNPPVAQEPSPGRDRAGRPTQEVIDQIYPSNVKKADDGNPVRPDTTAADALFTIDGSPPAEGTSHDVALAEIFDHHEKEARLAADLDLEKEIQSNRHGLEEGLAELGVGLPGTKEMTRLAKEYLDYPPSLETRETAMSDAMGVLAGEYGENTEKYIRGAQVVIQHLARRSPKLIPFLEKTGMGNDPRLVRMCVGIAKRKGFCK